MIKVIVFDMGGVVISYESFLEKFFTNAEECTGLEKQVLKAHFFNQVPYLERGDKSLEGIWKSLVKDDSKTKKLAGLFMDAYEGNVKKDTQLVRLVRKLKDRYFVCCLSNLGKEQKKINEKMGFYKPFSQIIVSSDYKMRKPQLKLFKIFLGKTKVNPGECLFIDDSKENVQAAKKVGMQVIHYSNYTQLKLSLKKFGVST